MSANEIVKLITEGGSLAALLAVLAGLYYIARSIVPSVKDFLSKLADALNRTETRTAVLETKLDAQAGVLSRIEEGVQAEAFEVRDHLHQAERRMTAAIRREQASDPPPTTRSSVPTPVLGHPMTRRASGG